MGKEKKYCPRVLARGNKPGQVCGRAVTGQNVVCVKCILTAEGKKMTEEAGVIVTPTVKPQPPPVVTPPPIKRVETPQPKESIPQSILSEALPIKEGEEPIPDDCEVLSTKSEPSYHSSDQEYYEDQCEDEQEKLDMFDPKQIGGEHLQVARVRDIYRSYPELQKRLPLEDLAALPTEQQLELLKTQIRQIKAQRIAKLGMRYSTITVENVGVGRGHNMKGYSDLVMADPEIEELSFEVGLELIEGGYDDMPSWMKFAGILAVSYVNITAINDAKNHKPGERTEMPYTVV